MKLINWIDRKLDEVKNSEKFSEYFSTIEIETIEGNKYLFNPEKGIDIVMSDLLIIQSIHLFSGKTPESKAYTGGKVHGLDFGMSKSDATKILGTPNKQGGGYKDIFGDVPAWDKYYFGTHALHLQYSLSDGSIELITILSLTLEPYLNSSLQ